MIAKDSISRGPSISPSSIARLNPASRPAAEPGTHIPPPLPPPHAGEGRVGARPVFMGSGFAALRRPGMTSTCLQTRSPPAPWRRLLIGVRRAQHGGVVEALADDLERQ